MGVILVNFCRLAHAQTVYASLHLLHLLLQFCDQSLLLRDDLLQQADCLSRGLRWSSSLLASALTDGFGSLSRLPGVKLILTAAFAERGAIA